MVKNKIQAKTEYKKKTKIIATISDRNCDVEFLRSLYEAGMDVVRLNTAHQSPEDTLKVIRNVREVSGSIPLLLDTKGPELRVTKVEEDIPVKKGDLINMVGGIANSTKEIVYVNYSKFADEVRVGQMILIDDGDIELEIKAKKEGILSCEVMNDGLIKSRKSVNIPDARLNLPSLSEKDHEYILFAIKNNLDFIAHSFVRSKKDVLDIQKILDKHNSQIKIIAKIENQEGIENIDEIIENVYGVMVARGDLGIEIPQERIPMIQKGIVRKCIHAKKPVIIATQMLHSMIKNPRPTRAEVSDVANAIYEGTDAIMLSGETASGIYPLESVKIMAKIAKEIEESKAVNPEIKLIKDEEILSYLASSSILASVQLKTKAIITDTATGRTARHLASLRGKNIVYALCYSDTIVRQLALSYGVYAECVKKRWIDELIRDKTRKLLKSGFIEEDDLVLVIAGSYGITHGASFIEISKAKNYLIFQRL
jgi:pyruvate kinase